MGEKFCSFQFCFFEAFDPITAMPTIAWVEQSVLEYDGPLFGGLGRWGEPEKETFEHCPFVGVGYPGAIPFVSCYAHTLSNTAVLFPPAHCSSSQPPHPFAPRHSRVRKLDRVLCELLTQHSSTSARPFLCQQPSRKNGEKAQVHCGEWTQQRPKLGPVTVTIPRPRPPLLLLVHHAASNQGAQGA